MHWKPLLITQLYSRLTHQLMLIHFNHFSNLIPTPTLSILSAWAFTKVSGLGLIPCVKVFPLHIMNLDLHLAMKNMQYSHMANASRNAIKATILLLLVLIYFQACILRQSMLYQNHIQMTYSLLLTIAQVHSHLTTWLITLESLAFHLIMFFI